jgi:hypothetical protein
MTAIAFFDLRSRNAAASISVIVVLSMGIV